MRDAVVVVGGGFFGVMLGLHLAELGHRVTVFERERSILSRASLANQARIHGGYHYPRSLLTARRSRANYARFKEEFSDAVVGGITHLYAVPRVGSKVSPGQFATFCRRIGSPIEVAATSYTRLFAPALIRDVWQVDESVFDATALREILERRLARSSVSLRLGIEVIGVKQYGAEVVVQDAGGGETAASLVFDCTYSDLNTLRKGSRSSQIPIKVELAEMALLRVPPVLETAAVTVMDGAFFSVMPYPPAGVHMLSHVRYTPRVTVATTVGDATAAKSKVGTWGPTDQGGLMLRDATRYLPVLADARLVGALTEYKAIMVASEHDDSRPIIADRSETLPALVSVLGSKLDNIYDVLAAADRIANGVMV